MFVEGRRTVAEESHRNEEQRVDGGDDGEQEHDPEDGAEEVALRGGD